MKYNNILFVGDSLTDVFDGYSLVENVKTLIRRNHTRNIGGYRHFCWKTGCCEVNDVRFSQKHSRRMWGRSDGNFGSSPFRYSPSGKGAYIESRKKKFQLRLRIPKHIEAKQATVYFMQHPCGGDLKIGWHKGLLNIKRTYKTREKTQGLEKITIKSPKKRGKNRTLTIEGGQRGKYYAAYGVLIKSEEVNISSFARAGATIDWFLSLVNLKQYVQDIVPDIVILNLGTNDLLVANKSADDYKKDLLKLASILKQSEAKVVVVEPNEISTNNRPKEQLDKLQLYKKARIEVAKAVNGIYFNLPSHIGNYINFSHNMRDNIHPNEKGQKEIAEVLYKELIQ